MRMDDTKRFTRAEVAQHNGRNNTSVWAIYKDSVYDVTKYVNEHPGGPEALSDNGGKDITKVFEEVGHSSDARQILSKYKIGEVIEEEKLYDANGKKLKQVKETQAKETGRSCMSIITCGLMG